MAVPQREYRPVIDSRPDMERTPEQVAHEEALHQVEETILNIEQAIKRADRARKAITGDAKATCGSPSTRPPPSLRASGKNCSRTRISAAASSGSSEPMRSGEEIQSALRAFAGQWRGYAGSERGEAQTYLNELIRCYGADRRAVGAEFEDATRPAASWTCTGRVCASSR